jgi:predicted PurR-regulated permease PerM
MDEPDVANGSKPARLLVPSRSGQAHPDAATPTAQFVQRVLVLLLLLAVAYVAWSGVHVLLQAFAGVLFAVFLSALSSWLSRHAGISYRWALVVIVLGLLVVAGGATWLLADRVATQTVQIKKELPRSFKQLQDYLKEYQWGHMLVESAPETAQRVTQEVGNFTRLTGLVAGVARFLEALVVILVVGVFGAAEPKVYREGVLHVVPRFHRRRAEQALDAVIHNLRWWLVGQVVLMLLIWITTTVGLLLIGVPLALALGFIAGVLELIPYVGPWLSAVPALLIALLAGPEYVMMTAALYLGLHIVEGYVLVPLIQRRAVHLPPALTLVMQVLIAELLGVLGLFVAAPLTVVGLVLVKMLYVEDALGDETVDVPGEQGNEAKPVAKEGRTLGA